MIIVLKPKQHCHLVLLFLIASFSSLFQPTHARYGATPAYAPHVPNEGANTALPTLLVVFVFAFFITGFCSFYIHYCSERYVVEPNDAVLSSKGIDPELLATCPIVVYSAVKTGCCHVALQCAVCLGEFCDLDAVRLLPKCSHVFHPGCIDTWLASHVTCPVCRSEIGGENGARQVFGESSVRRAGGENGSGVCGNVDGGVGKGNGSSKVSAFGVLVRSHSTGHSLVEPGTKSLERFTKKEIVEDKGGDFVVMKRSASYDVVLQIKKEGVCLGKSGGEEGSSRKGKSNGFGCGSSGASTTCSGIPRLWVYVAREDKESQERTIFQFV